MSTNTTPETPADGSNNAVRCYYEILGVPRDADERTIQQAHRRLARQHHPDRPNGNAELFRQVQSAYECLTNDRQWYDEHRDAILRGWTINNDDGSSFSVDVARAMTPSFCSDTATFYSAYSRLFTAIYKEESQANPDQADYLNVPLGTADSDYITVVAVFYQAWNSFASVRSYAWADVYDTTTDAIDRRMRRAMEDANQKARSRARKDRNNEVRRLVQWVQHRDVRVMAWNEQRAREKERQQKEAAEQQRQVKVEQAALRAEWSRQQREEMVAVEEQDRIQGRVRLADLEDEEYEYAVGGKKKKKKGKKKKSREERDTLQKDFEDDGNSEKDLAESSEMDNNVVSACDFEGKDTGEEAHPPECTVSLDTSNKDDEDCVEDVEPDTWRCECCRKDFKSEAQLENHLKSKKHKAMFKKYTEILKSMEEDVSLQ